MKVKATKEFNNYRCNVLGLKIEDFRALQASKIIDIEKDKIKERPYLYMIIKEKKEDKDGDK